MIKLLNKFYFIIKIGKRMINNMKGSSRINKILNKKYSIGINSISNYFKLFLFIYMYCFNDIILFFMIYIFITFLLNIRFNKLIDWVKLGLLNFIYFIFLFIFDENLYNWDYSNIYISNYLGLYEFSRSIYNRVKSGIIRFTNLFRNVNNNEDNNVNNNEDNNVNNNEDNNVNNNEDNNVNNNNTNNSSGNWFSFIFNNIYNYFFNRSNDSIVEEVNIPQVNIPSKVYLPVPIPAIVLLREYVLSPAFVSKIINNSNLNVITDNKVINSEVINSEVINSEVINSEVINSDFIVIKNRIKSSINLYDYSNSENYKDTPIYGILYMIKTSNKLNLDLDEQFKILIKKNINITKYLSKDGIIINSINRQLISYKVFFNHIESNYDNYLINYKGLWGNTIIKKVKNFIFIDLLMNNNIFNNNNLKGITKSIEILYNNKFNFYNNYKKLVNYNIINHTNNIYSQVISVNIQNSLLNKLVTSYPNECLIAQIKFVLENKNLSKFIMSFDCYRIIAKDIVHNTHLSKSNIIIFDKIKFKENPLNWLNDNYYTKSIFIINLNKLFYEFRQTEEIYYNQISKVINCNEDINIAKNLYKKRHIDRITFLEQTEISCINFLYYDFYMKNNVKDSNDVLRHVYKNIIFNIFISDNNFKAVDKTISTNNLYLYNSYNSYSKNYELLDNINYFNNSKIKD